MKYIVLLSLVSLTIFSHLPSKLIAWHKELYPQMTANLEDIALDKDNIYAPDIITAYENTPYAYEMISPQKNQISITHFELRKFYVKKNGKWEHFGYHFQIADDVQTRIHAVLYDINKQYIGYMVSTQVEGFNNIYKVTIEGRQNKEFDRENQYIFDLWQQFASHKYEFIKQ